VRDLADAGTAVLWATQRIEEIRGFADTVTVLGRGAVRFDGTVPELLARSPANGTGVPGHPGPELEEAVLALTAEAVRT
jgi:ABC-type multidrug transport system ATPase subunit